MIISINHDISINESDYKELTKEQIEKETSQYMQDRVLQAEKEVKENLKGINLKIAWRKDWA